MKEQSRAREDYIEPGASGTMHETLVHNGAYFLYDIPLCFPFVSANMAGVMYLQRPAVSVR